MKGTGWGMMTTNRILEGPEKHFVFTVNLVSYLPSGCEINKSLTLLFPIPVVAD